MTQRPLDARFTFTAVFLGALLATACGGSEGEQSALSAQEGVAGVPGTASLVVLDSGKCADVAGASKTAGAQVAQWTCQGSTSQEWQFKNVSGSVYELVSVNSGQCMTVAGASTAAGALVQQEPCTSAKNQQWTISSVASGEFRLQAVHSGLCLDVKGAATTDGADFDQWTCHNSGNQTFTLSTSSSGNRKPTGVWTNRYDNARTGSQLTETTLTPAKVGTRGSFGLLFSRHVDSTILAQPLYAPGLKIGSATHNVVFVATEHNSVYAFDADDPMQSSPLWKTNLGPAAPFAGAPWTCKNLIPESGISGTPVVDPASGTIYVIAETLEGGTYHHKLHALNWTTGAERTGSPVEIKPNGPNWSPTNHFSRVGLLLDHGVVYGAFASQCDMAPYRGWVVAYDAATLAFKGWYATGLSGGIWQSGQGLSTDGNGNVYFVAGVSSAAQAACSSTDLCQSVGSLTLGSGGFKLNHSWTLGKVAGLDLDLTTAFILGNGLGFASGKDGFVHVLNPSNLQHLQDLQVSTVINGSGTGGHVHGGPVFWDGPSGPLLYVWPEANPLHVYAVTSTGLNSKAVGTNASRQPSHPGPIITLSSNGKTAGTGILWATMATMDGVDTWHGIFPGTLYAFDAQNVSKELWNSDESGADALGMFAKFCPPMVVNGKVYVGTAGGTDALRVYGLR